MSKKSSLIVTVLLIVVGLAGRFLPHPWNMTPLTAIAIFSSTYLSLRYSFLIFFLTMVVADIFLGFYEWQIMLAVYGSFALASLIGLIIRRHKMPTTILFCSLGSSVLFFLLTNFAVWQFSGMYEHTLVGIIQCFTLAIPFFKNALFGDLLYSGVLFGAYETVKYLSLQRSLSREKNSLVHVS